MDILINRMSYLLTCLKIKCYMNFYMCVFLPVDYVHIICADLIINKRNYHLSRTCDC